LAEGIFSIFNLLDINLFLFDTIAAMNELIKEIGALIQKLERSNLLVDSTEHITLNHLKKLVTAAENTEGTPALKRGFADLEQFWASSVDWCSELSKDLEKIIIMHRELL